MVGGVRVDGFRVYVRDPGQGTIAGVTCPDIGSYQGSWVFVFGFHQNTVPNG